MSELKEGIMIPGDPRLKSLYRAAEAAFVTNQTAEGVQSKKLKTWLGAEVVFLQATSFDLFV